METITFDGVEFTKIRYIYGDEKVIQDGLLVHDLKDEFHNGDGITDGGLPTDAEDAENILTEYIDTYWTIDENGIYHIG